MATLTSIGRKGISRALIIILLIIVIVAVAGGWWYYTGTQKSEEPIRVGLLAALSGPNAVAGTQLKNGAEMAVEEWNEEGGILGRKVELVYYDTQGDTTVATTEYERLVANDEVDVVTGVTMSGIGIALEESIARYKVIMMHTVAASTAITEPVATDYDKYKYIFQPCPSSEVMWISSAEWIEQYWGPKVGKEFAIICKNSKATIEASDNLKDYLTTKGFTCVHYFTTEQAQEDYSAELTAIKNSEAKAIFQFIDNPGGVSMVRQWCDMKVPAPLVGMNLVVGSRSGAIAAEGKAMYSLNFVYGEKIPITDRTIQFWNNYVEKFGITPNPQSMNQYDSLYLWRDAVIKAGTVESDAVIKELEGFDKQEGVLGYYTFTASHGMTYGLEYRYMPLVQFLGTTEENLEVVQVWPLIEGSSEYTPASWTKEAFDLP